MTLTWAQFKEGVPSRFLLPLTQYWFRAGFVQFVPSPEELLEIGHKITTAAFEAVQSSPSPTMQALRRVNVNDQRIFAIHYGDPTYEFQIQLETDNITIAKGKCTLEALLGSLPLIEDLADRLFSPSSETSLAQHVFFRRTFRTTHMFNQSVTLGPRLSDETQTPTNVDVMKHFLNTTDNSIVDIIQPERILRNDVDISLDKTIDGRIANVWINVEAPWNQSQRDLVFEFQLRRGDSPGAKLIASDLFEHGVVVEQFYRDLVLSRVFRTLFHDISVLPAI
jgi:hypothetical protein